MNQELADLLEVSQEYLAVGFFVMLRVGPIIGFMPGYGEAVVSVRVKLALGLCLTLAVLPLIEPGNLPSERSEILATVFRETVLGLFFGLGMRFFVIALQTAGSMAAQATSLAQLFAGAAAEPMPAIGHLLVVSGLALAMIIGLPVRVIEFLDMTYRAFPLGGDYDLSRLAEWASGLVSRSFALAFSMAAPFLVMSLLYNLVLGVINRAMPQLMVAFVGAPVITAGGLIFLLIFGPIMLSLWWSAFDAFLSRPGGFAR
ncbi:MAG: flagellar biosynthetic protein FliR [Spiribacter salinus]|uniref:Flagellar biosynthetic protein FliR n=1 Tax=Spiribacter salinus TaxID=1335746 RepID=A0A540VXJ4_9GAMM|nr:MAG: flagellar biosynthetic protein FliR [Spiribacter salinus]